MATAFVDQTDLLKLYVGLGTDRAPVVNAPMELRVGRFTMDLGSRRLNARFNYGNVPFSFEGVHLLLGSDRD